jgi:ParB-like chromosome segregation protein Spo0J
MKSLETGLVRILSLSSLRPAKINEAIYRPVSESDPAVIELAQSISQRGVLTPISVTYDGVIVSGHRRTTAARLAGLTQVPAIVLDLHSADPDFPQLLVEFNLSREKTNEERLCEAIATADAEDPYAAWRRLRAHRAERSRVSADFVEIVGTKKRAGISSAKEPMLRAIEKVLEERREFWPLSDRQIHYALLNHLPLKHAKKPESVYANNPASYKDLTDLLTRARLTGRVPFDAIADETRTVSVWDVHQTTAGFLKREVDGFLKGYARDLQQDQPNHIEIIAEKNTVKSIVEQVAAEFAIPVTVNRGYCSLDPRHALAKRFKASGRDHLVLIVLTDHDPDGEEILQSFARSLCDDFGIAMPKVVKAAITGEHVERYNLPPSMKAKTTSSQYDKFVQEHGDYAYELEALSPETLQALLREAIESVIDRETLDRQKELEAQDAREMEAKRRQLLSVIGGQGQ